MIQTLPTLNEKEKKILEHLLYLPLLLAVLERDRKNVERAPFKFKKVYVNLMENTMKKVQGDMNVFQYKSTKYRMKLIKGRNGKDHTEYHFYIQDCHYVFLYSNAELKINTEKLLCYYLFKETNHSFRLTY